MNLFHGNSVYPRFNRTQFAENFAAFLFYGIRNISFIDDPEYFRQSSVTMLRRSSSFRFMLMLMGMVMLVFMFMFVFVMSLFFQDDVEFGGGNR